MTVKQPTSCLLQLVYCLPQSRQHHASWEALLCLSNIILLRIQVANLVQGELLDTLSSFSWFFQRKVFQGLQWFCPAGHLREYFDLARHSWWDVSGFSGVIKLHSELAISPQTRAALGVSNGQQCLVLQFSLECHILLTNHHPLVDVSTSQQSVNRDCIPMTLVWQTHCSMVWTNTA